MPVSGLGRVTTTATKEERQASHFINKQLLYTVSLYLAICAQRMYNEQLSEEPTRLRIQTKIHKQKVLYTSL
jgi:hypothetical protein